MTVGQRKNNDFCWINVVTPEADCAGSFFGRLFGWTYGTMPGVPGGQLILVGGHVAGALMDREASKMPEGTPPNIDVMIKVENADASVDKINALGGHAKPAFDVLTNGRMAMCEDPNGAVFGIWQPRAQGGMEADTRTHGAPTWFETLTSDVGRAVKFYATLFRWTAEDQPMPEVTYTRFNLGALPVAGAMPILPRMGSIPSHWGTYFAVTDTDATVRLGVELGATLCMPAQDIPTVGRFAMLKSPQGVPFYVIKYLAGVTRAA